ncbi:unnamed protein product, partial [Prorocentrum cordatum]
WPPSLPRPRPGSADAEPGGPGPARGHQAAGRVARRPGPAGRVGRLDHQPAVRGQRPWPAGVEHRGFPFPAPQGAVHLADGERAGAVRRRGLDPPRGEARRRRRRAGPGPGALLPDAALPGRRRRAPCQLEQQRRRCGRRRLGRRPPDERGGGVEEAAERLDSGQDSWRGKPWQRCHAVGLLEPLGDAAAGNQPG